ncbi:MAG TPA: T9SS type A sorting domain-containing protein [Candidatus Kapabacteria bacterium]|nr:T9SS type A sorting domain-containing protein [Candidatus Kapabacteria bacterium]
MKRKFIPIILIVFASVPCSAQWKSIFGSPGDWRIPYLAFGVHDSSLFVSASGEVLRYTVAQGWPRADTGLDFSQGDITSFVSLGPYVFAGFTYNGNHSPLYRSTNDGSFWATTEKATPECVSEKYIIAYGGFLSGGAGLYRSSDSGVTWDSLAKLSITTLAANGPIILASNGSIAYRSLDTGTHWSTLPNLPTGLSLSTYAIINSWMFAAENVGFFRSTDSGQSWSKITTPPLGVSNGRAAQGIHALAAYQTYLFAGTDSGVFMSHDSGMTWQGANQGLIGFPHANVTLLAVLDTLLIADVDAGYGDPYDFGYVAARSISEMIKDTTASVVQVVPATDSIDIYPNPASGAVTVSSSTKVLSIEARNVLGEEVLSTQYREPSTGNVTLDLSKLPSGTYFLRIQTAGNSTIKKITVER